MKKNSKYDLIVMGATGFTGKLVVEYLIKNYGAKNEMFSWAIAGRDKNKLEALKISFRDIDSFVNDIPIFIVDSHNSESLDNMTSSCRLVISTVGPYLKFGKPLIQACVKSSTHYCDLTGEIPFIRETIDLFDEKAKKNKCRIIHSCGFDSLPSDIGVLLLQKNSFEKINKTCDEVNLYVRSIQGGFSGGTIESMINISNYLDSHPEYQNILKSPFSLNPRDMMKSNARQSTLKTVKWDSDTQQWICPFIMSGINTRVVRRTNAIADFSYGKNFKYSEVYSFRKGINGFLKALIMFSMLVILQICIKLRPLLWILRKITFPKAGEGPSREKRENGFFKLKLIGLVNNVQKNSVTIIGNSDPGYSATAKMLTESALSILLNEENIPRIYGVLTPASGIGLILIKRLKGKGITFTIDEQSLH